MIAGRTRSDHTGHPITLSRTVCILILLRLRGVLMVFVIEHHLMKFMHQRDENVCTNVVLMKICAPTWC
jgi:hypothetical protein